MAHKHDIHCLDDRLNSLYCKVTGKPMNVPRKPRLPPRALIERAVKQAQLYHGSLDLVRNVRDQQRLYDRLETYLQAIVKKSGMDYYVVADQVVKEAQKRGRIVPSPGKDY